MMAAGVPFGASAPAEGRTPPRGSNSSRLGNLTQWFVNYGRRVRVRRAILPFPIPILWEPLGASLD